MAFLDVDKVKAEDQDFTRHRSFKDAERRSIGARNATKRRSQRQLNNSMLGAHLRYTVEDGQLQRTSRLPQWLLINKLFLREAMARFSHKSHWLLRPYSSAGPYMPLPTMTIMIPGLARSLSLGEWSFESTPKAETLRKRNVIELMMPFARSDINWLDNLSDYLREQNRVEGLSLIMAHPDWYTDLNLRVTLDLALLQRLLSCLQRLQTLKIKFWGIPDMLCEVDAERGKFWPHHGGLFDSMVKVIRSTRGDVTFKAQNLARL